jgi:hypothetical protein
VVCDAARGLLRLDPESGRASELVTGFRGEPFVFCNNAAVAADGTIYFTDSSRRFGIGAFRAELVEHSGSGRLFRRAPQGAVDLLADGLSFPNGVALAADESFVAFAETASYRVRRYWLDGPASGQVAAYVDDLPGFPDNLSTGSNGLVWVAVAAPRDPILDLLLPRAPVLRKAVWAVPERLQPRAKRRFWVLGSTPPATLSTPSAERTRGSTWRPASARGTGGCGSAVWSGRPLPCSTYDGPPTMEVRTTTEGPA